MTGSCSDAITLIIPAPQCKTSKYNVHTVFAIADRSAHCIIGIGQDLRKTEWSHLSVYHLYASILLNSIPLICHWGTMFALPPVSPRSFIKEKAALMQKDQHQNIIFHLPYRYEHWAHYLVAQTRKAKAVDWGNIISLKLIDIVLNTKSDIVLTHMYLGWKCSWCTAFVYVWSISYYKGVEAALTIWPKSGGGRWAAAHAHWIN